MLELRARQQRNFLTTLFLSQGVPMLLGGDEISRTQHGNNNAWCQDNEISWYEWGLRSGQGELYDFTRRVLDLRHRHRVFRREKFLAGREQEGSGLPDVWWFRPDGRRMTQRDWQDRGAHVVGVFLNGAEIADRTPEGRPIDDDSFLVLFNGHYEDVRFTLPARRFGTSWTHELCTARPELPSGSERHAAREELRRDRALGDAAAAGDAVSELRATYRLQLSPQLDFAAVARARPLPARPGDLAPVPVARAAGAQRLDARLRRRGSHARVGRAGR